MVHRIELLINQFSICGNFSQFYLIQLHRLNNFLLLLPNTYFLPPSVWHNWAIFCFFHSLKKLKKILCDLICAFCSIPSMPFFLVFFCFSISKHRFICIVLRFRKFTFLCQINLLDTLFHYCIAWCLFNCVCWQNGSIFYAFACSLLSLFSTALDPLACRLSMEPHWFIHNWMAFVIASYPMAFVINTYWFFDSLYLYLQHFAFV